jgi:hypothetical protein
VTAYTVTMKDRTTEHIADVDAYQQEGPMTTFFRLGSGRQTVDTWSTRVASIRTSEVVVIRRDEDLAAASAGAPGPADATVRALRPSQTA